METHNSRGWRETGWGGRSTGAPAIGLTVPAVIAQAETADITLAHA